MTQRQEIIERLNGLEMEGGSHAMLSAICKAVLPHGDAWTLRRCADLRDRLVRLLGEADTPTSSGCITDELRNHARLYEQHKRAHIECIANRIDAEHEKAIASVMNDALYHANDKDMADLGWIRLPKDADGEYIHIGDRMENNERVARIVLTDGSWEPSVYLEKLTNVLHEYFCNEISHYHAPTVEDVLREFADEVRRCCDSEQTIAEYAAKLRLAGDAE